MRRNRRRGGNKEKVFGCDLLEHLATSCQEIPLVLRSCSEFVEEHGVVDGIYRLSGVSSNIQKLRGDFDSDASPDLNKDVYLQDIHCVSSLCKAYFRELPNPLLTYQLYDKFAEAVAIQLEEERLVKIRDVLKELPTLHHRTLEFLMRHLVKMASYSSETNMHARNLAIVWAPNLLRSKDIEASGFNGTAAFMEVRVQSIVVEFILTHVPQLFPEDGVSSERRKSLPSPSLTPNQDMLFQQKSPQPNFGNISPGDGPLPIRPYHAIIEGTDKRKGSLKGRKWMSIFNIGGRFQDPRRRHKHSAKEKDRPALRPARSMDNLRTPYPNEGTVLSVAGHSALRPPSSDASPAVNTSSQSGPDMTISAGGIGGSEYAVTYRRGTGLVSGGAGTQGTYTALDPDSLGMAGSEGVQSRSPGLSSKAGRRAAMHITGPTMVRVPLHITSNLALGVLQGGGSDRLIHRGRDKDRGDKVEGMEVAEKVEKKEQREIERKVKEDRKAEEEKKNQREQGDVKLDGNKEEVVGEKKRKGTEKEGEEEMRGEPKQEPVMGGQGVPREQRVKSHNSKEDDNKDAPGVDQVVDDINDYIDMEGNEQEAGQPAEVTQHERDGVFDASDILNSTETEPDDPELSGYVQESLEFLDHILSMPYQVNEFSVEPPGHSDDEYEIMEQAQCSQHPAAVETQSPTELSPHRPLSLDLHSRHTKSLSLPYMTSPIHAPEDSCSEDSCSEDEALPDDGYPNDYSSEEDDESMFMQSLPADFILNTLPGIELDTESQDQSQPEHVQGLQSSEEKHCQSLNLELPACKETSGKQEQVHEECGDEEDGLEEMGVVQKKEDQVQHGQDQLKDEMQSGETEEGLSITEQGQSEKSPTLETPTTPVVEVQQLSSEDSNESNPASETEAGDVEEEAEISPSDCPPQGTLYAMQKETFTEFTDAPVKLETHASGCVEELATESENTCQKSVPETKNSHENMCEEDREEVVKGSADEKYQEESRAICGENPDIWNELEDVICEVIEDEENEQCERVVAGSQADVVKDGAGEEETADSSAEKVVEAGDVETNKTEFREEEEGASLEAIEVKLRESEEYETDSPMGGELESTCQEKCAFSEETQHHERAEVVTEAAEKEKNENERADEGIRAQPSGDKQLTANRSEMKEVSVCKKLEDRNSTSEGIGRKLIVSKQPKVYQVKAVPVVPPKPQHCKAAARHLRQRQQRECREAESGKDNLQSVPAEQDKVGAGEQAEDGEDRSAQRKERPTPLKERERRREGAEGAVATRDSSRNSPLSMCFDEAVAMATMRREKERAREGEADAEGLRK
ncbi:rho GTPase-activating protein 30 [Cololabis saira]|uniref:rho GTPase-activating protein 30 n=1 Tax=Cololabis saira TaxID=129043 RepID=UPI002AD597FB|nr:rho GTPase-activating protein 30 [Cololabis saira]XP_061587882.1 rho GTPase-activating protein 30 [Cololabis saira]